MNRTTPPNPWNKNPVNNNRQKRNPKNPTNNQNSKFKEAHLKLQNAVQKHIKDYASSSEDEDNIDSNTVIDTVLKKYVAAFNCSKDESQLSRTEKYLEDAFQANATTCLICISKIKRDSEIWNCKSCFGMFHLLCISRWSKDSVVQQKHAIEPDNIEIERQIFWGCPKCRFEYPQHEIPSKYVCFCGKLANPKFDPFLVPHSCGEICRKDLQPVCGHKCMLLCHPGPCPPCPITIPNSCYCGSQPLVMKRCSNREWSCGDRCGKMLSCEKHTCSDPCHAGECAPCSKKSIQKCICGAQQKLRDCANPTWECDKVCNKLLECGNHKCQIVCHSGVCDMCQLSKPRTCPCGKTKYQLPCTEEDTPTCFDTCAKILDCGQHTCNFRCHKGSCGQCLETVRKLCRCGQHSKEIQCSKPYLCETKCKGLRDCNKHPCNRKCCDGFCPPCEKMCGQTLKCGNHKCSSVCHRGLCYPCQQTDTVACRCGFTQISVPCGRKYRTKPPKCLKLCTIPPDCHHKKRDSHKCHFGDCPPCKQKCDKELECGHKCLAQCHMSVLVKVEGQKANMPWEETGPMLERRRLDCPPCSIPIPIKCLGEHEVSNLPCHVAKSANCGRICGRLVECGNHLCTIECHIVREAINDTLAGKTCEPCENHCTKPRPNGCLHECPKPCHPGDCPPCKKMTRIKCHCGLTQPYVSCQELLTEVDSKREMIQSCGNRCPKTYDCGHRCKSNCHSGPCPNAESCKKKVKISCVCKRIKKEFACELVRNGLATVDCDGDCQKALEVLRRTQLLKEEEKRKEEEVRNKIELEKYQKMFEGKKRSNRDRRNYSEVEESNILSKYSLYILFSSCILVISFVLYYFVV